MLGFRVGFFRFFRTIAKVVPPLVSIQVAFGLAGRPVSAQGEQVWLTVSDVHLNLFDRSIKPSPNATDANRALFKSALEQMKRAVHHPAIVLLPGDFLMHNFREQAAHNGVAPDEAGIRTMRWIAVALERAFPTAQFAIALGNNDIPCGDYKSDDGSTYLGTLARVWNPLVNRDGAAPGFAASFVRGGYYTMRLPVRGMRLVVLNTVLLSSEYRGECAGDHNQAASEELAWLRRTLRDTPRGTRNVVMMHVPPGYDAFSTDYVRGFLSWTFLKSRYNAELVGALSAPADRVAYAIAGHAHRFDFMIAGTVPVIVFGSLSPIYGNNPAFYTMRVLPNGLLHDIDVYPFDESILNWLRPRSFDRTWRVRRIDAVSLSQLHALLGNSPAARAEWDEQATGWPTDLTVARGTWQADRWRISWCAQTFLIAKFARCAGIERRIRIAQMFVGVIVAAVALTMLVVILRRPIGDQR